MAGTYVINASPNRLPTGINGQYMPYAELTDLPAVGLGGDNHGLLYPVNYDTTTQALINTNASLVGANSATDDGIYANAEVKKKLIGNYFNLVKSVDSVLLQDTGRGTFTMAASMDNANGQCVVGLVEGFVLVELSAGDIIARYITVDDYNSMTFGTFTSALATGGGTYMTAQRISDTEVFVAYDASGTIKTLILTINEGTGAIVGSTVHTTAITDCSIVLGACLYDTNKIAVSYINTSNHLYAYATSNSSGTFTDGSAVLVDNGTNAFNAQNKVQTIVALSATELALISDISTSRYIHYVSASGTTLTDYGTKYSPSITTSTSILSFFALNGKANLLYVASTTQLKILSFEFGQEHNGGSSIVALSATLNNVVVKYPLIENGSATFPVIRSYTDGGNVRAIRMVRFSGSHMSSATESILKNTAVPTICQFADRSAVLVRNTDAIAIPKKTVDIGIDGVDVLTTQSFGLCRNFTLSTSASQGSTLEIENNSGAERSISVPSVICNVS